MSKTATQAPEEPRRRGRPRPTEVIERDEKVFAALTEPTTTRSLAESTGLERNHVFLSLWRLRAAERVRRVPAGDGAAPWTWERVG